jgi:hypothetical protein
VFGELERRFMRLGSWVIALVCGSMGVFTLWFSYLSASLIPDAAGFLAIAVAVDLASRRFLVVKSKD